MINISDSQFLLLEISRCIYSKTPPESLKEITEEKTVSVINSKSSMLIYITIGLLVLSFIGYKIHLRKIPKTKANKTVSEPKPFDEPVPPHQQIVIELDGSDVYDLATEEGLKRWKQRFENTIKQIKETQQVSQHQSDQTEVIQDENLVRKQANFSNKDQLKDFSQKARTDLNIHNPNLPIPSVLKHPTQDKKGNTLRRIFLPGRGWVSAKKLAMEREVLLTQIEPTQPLPYEENNYKSVLHSLRY